ncbi:MAG: hypothetical protein ACF8NJ_02150, partial [Phycisphaerales bacterium JB038]
MSDAPKPSYPTGPQFDIVCDQPGKTVSLRIGDRLTVGSAAECALRTQDGPSLVGEFDVEWYHPAYRDEGRKPRARLYFTPAWPGPDSEVVLDAAARVHLDHECTVAAGSAELTIRAVEPEPSSRFRRFRAFAEWIKRPFPSFSSRQRTRIGVRHKPMHGRWRSYFENHFGVVVDEDEASAAGRLLTRGRVASPTAVALGVAVALLALWAVQENYVQAAPAAIGVVTLAAMILAFSTTFFFAAVGPFVLAPALAAVALLLPSILGVSHLGALVALPFALFAAWQWGTAVDVAWLPLPSTDRFGEALTLWLAPPDRKSVV